MLDHFSLAAPGFQVNTGYRGENQLGWMFAQNEIRVKSWETTQSNLCTEIKVDPAEFDYYWLENNVRIDLTLPMREFRVSWRVLKSGLSHTDVQAALTLAEQLGIRLAVAYSVPSQPLTITSAPDDDEPDNISDLKYEVFCAIATTACEAFAEVVERKPSTSAAGSTVPRGSGSVSNSHSASQANQNKRKRTTLSMSSERAGQYATVIRNSVSDDTSGQGNTEPLFLSNSQEAPASQMASQQIRMSQQEVLEMAGLGDMDEDELMGAIEAGEEEDMQEEEEQDRRDRLAAQDGAEMDGTLDGIASIRGRPDNGEAEISGLDFEPDSDIFGGEVDQTVLNSISQGQQRRPSQPAKTSQRSPNTDDPPNEGAGNADIFEEEAFESTQPLHDRSVGSSFFRASAKG